VTVFVERCQALGVEVRRAQGEREAVAVAAAWVREAGASLVADASPLAQAVLKALGESLAPASEAEVGVTAAWGGVAETGTLVFHANAGRQAALLPPTHLAFLWRRDLRAGLTELYRALADAPLDTAAWVQVTGPSRTADIEMTLVTGVHGPERVWVVLIDDV
jgi:L-lactate dehydrogenase complex protein LldG